MSFVIPAPAAVTVPVAGGDRFPVRRIWCVGQNYAAHAREMGADPMRQDPFFFAKPADAVVADGGDFPYPPMSQAVHHEVELVVALARGGRDIAVDAAAACVFGYAVGFDMTRRDLQSAAKAAGRPWEMGKAFDHSAPIGTISPAAPVADAAIRLEIDGQTRQSGRLGDMIWTVPEIIAFLSRYVALHPGDLIFTGTPEGVGPVERGQTLLGHVDGLKELVMGVA